MCRKLVVTNQIFLGTRAICYESYRLPKGEVVELTEKQIKDALKEIKTLLDMHIISAGARLANGVIDVSQFADFEKMKENVRVRLVNTELNKERLSDIANVPFLDLSIIFYVWIDSGACKNGSITIHKEHLKLWGKTEEELLEIALENSRNEYAFASIMDFIATGLLSFQVRCMKES